eukprot:TRINITY_DN350_c0_g3_i4.p1 TRINITY_DN350_c0_g3~~TRINITY_DN350_c0_g3_i4.p1  ORF type:complete len:252 (+),score=56.49 TRINITY_DN350_c0_g3_i4:119-874(+)
MSLTTHTQYSRDTYRQLLYFITSCLNTQTDNPDTAKRLQETLNLHRTNLLNPLTITPPSTDDLESYRKSLKTAIASRQSNASQAEKLAEDLGINIYEADALVNASIVKHKTNIDIVNLATTQFFDERRLLLHCLLQILYATHCSLPPLLTRVLTSFTTSLVNDNLTYFLLHKLKTKLDTKPNPDESLAQHNTTECVLIANCLLALTYQNTNITHQEVLQLLTLIREVADKSVQNPDNHSLFEIASTLTLCK